MFYKDAMTYKNVLGAALSIVFPGLLQCKHCCSGECESALPCLRASQRTRVPGVLYFLAGGVLPAAGLGCEAAS